MFKPLTTVSKMYVCIFVCVFWALSIHAFLTGEVDWLEKGLYKVKGTHSTGHIEAENDVIAIKCTKNSIQSFHGHVV